MELVVASGSNKSGNSSGRRDGFPGDGDVSLFTTSEELLDGGGGFGLELQALRTVVVLLKHIPS